MALLTLLLFGAADVARAAIGETAARGDNCTPYKNLAVGVPIPGAGKVLDDIVDQAVLLDHGWQPLGWVITGQDGRYFFTPFRLGIRTTSAPTAAAYISAIPSVHRDRVAGWYADVRRRSIEAGVARPEDFVDDLRSFTLNSCFAKPLSIERL